VSFLFGLFVAQLIDPVRIVLAGFSAYIICKALPKGRRFTALSIATVVVCAVMTVILTFMQVVAPSQERIAISLVVGLLSTGVIVAITAALISKRIQP